MSEFWLTYTHKPNNNSKGQILWNATVSFINVILLRLVVEVFPNAIDIWGEGRDLIICHGQGLCGVIRVK